MGSTHRFFVDAKWRKWSPNLKRFKAVLRFGRESPSFSVPYHGRPMRFPIDVCVDWVLSDVDMTHWGR